MKYFMILGFEDSDVNSINQCDDQSPWRYDNRIPNTNWKYGNEFYSKSLRR